MNSYPSQACKILARLQSTPGQWVPMPELAACSGAYAVHSRMAELRREHPELTFEHRLEAIPGSRQRASFYRITQPKSILS